MYATPDPPRDLLFRLFVFRVLSWGGSTRPRATTCRAANTRSAAELMYPREHKHETQLLQERDVSQKISLT